MADRLKETVAGRTVDHLSLDQALADQRGQQVKHLPFRDAAAGGDRFRGVQPVQPAALVRPGQMSGRRLGDGQVVIAVCDADVAQKTESRSNTLRSSGLSRS